MDMLSKKELEGLKGDREKGEKEMGEAMNLFAERLRNGLGEEIREGAGNRNLNKVESGPVYRIRKWMRDRKERRKINKIFKGYKDYGTEI